MKITSVYEIVLTIAHRTVCIQKNRNNSIGDIKM